MHFSIMRGEGGGTSLFHLETDFHHTYKWMFKDISLGSHPLSIPLIH